LENNIFAIPTQATCGFVNKKTGNICSRAAGFGTDHPGEGLCVFHEKNIVAQTKETINVRNYLISSLDPGRRAMAQQFIEEPEELYSLKNTIAYMKALLQSLTDRLESNEEMGEELSSRDLRDFLSLVKQLTTTIEAAVRMEKGIHRYIHVEVLQMYTQLFVDNVRTFLTDPDQMTAFLFSLERGISDLSNKNSDGNLVAAALLGSGEEED
jgi:hypothetical protein